MWDKGELVTEYMMYIDGGWTKATSEETINVENPFDKSIVGQVPSAGREDARKAIEAAYNAREIWADMLAVERAGYLYNLFYLMRSKADELIDILIRESGSTLKKASMEVNFTLGMLLSAAEEARRVRGETIPSDMGMFSFTLRQPVGVVVAISPYNFPLLLSMKKVFHALAAGDTVVLKPSSKTPINSLFVADMINQIGFPRGVFNVVTGRGSEVGDELVSNRKVNHISFTGEYSTGKSIALKAASNLKKVTLELGSSDPLLILNDADIGYAVDAAIFGAFFHQGQICMSAKRIILHRDISSEFMERFIPRVESLIVGNPMNPSTQIGPLIDEEQINKIESQVQDAISKGATLLCGGKREGPFYLPTVLCDITPEMRMYHEEVFGPARSVMVVDDETEAIRLANDTIYGLSCGIITRDVNNALSMAKKLDFGMVHINDSPVVDESHIPFGGMKCSGLGREGGRYSIEELTDLKWITISKKHPFMI